MTGFELEFPKFPLQERRTAPGEVLVLGQHRSRGGAGAHSAVDFLLWAKRDVAAAKAFFRRAFEAQGRLPQKITLDGYQASHRAARECLEEHKSGGRTKIRSSKYLNNLIEQDHRSIKLRLAPMLGLKRFHSARVTIAGIELMHRIRKGQFKLGKLGVKGKTAPEIWDAVLAS